MNLLVKKFGPLTVILLSALIAISCEDPGRIGLIVDGNNGVISTHYQDIVLSTAVVQFDLRKTSESKSIQAGEYFNPDFGVVTSKAYTWLRPSTLIVPEPAAEYTSFEVKISFTSFDGETPQNSETQQISLYQLTEEIDPAAEYNRLDELAISPSPLAVWDFAPKVNDTIQVDSVYIVTLDDGVGQDLFQKLKDEDPIFDDESAFNAYFKGVAFVPTLGNIDVFQFDADQMTFSINYNEFNSDGTPIERNYDMFISTTGFYHLNSDRTGTPISGINPDNTDYFPPDDYRYLQFGTLMALRADLTPFFELTDTLSNLIINKAEIYLGGVKQYGDDFQPPAFLQVYFTDETNEWPIVDDVGRFDTTQVGVHFIMLQDEGTQVRPGVYVAPQDTFYDRNDFNYRVNMSLFLQNLYSGNFHSESEPFLEEKGQIFIFGETNILTPQKTTSHFLSTLMAVHKDSIRLRIHYTIPTEQNQ